MAQTTMNDIGSIRAVQLYDRLARLIARGGWPSRYGSAVFGVALVTLVLARSQLGLDQAHIALTYLLAIFCVAGVAGLGPGVVASLLSFLLYNYSFVPPFYVLTVEQPQDLLRLIVFLIAALLASCMAALALERAQLLRQIAEQEAAAAADRIKATVLSSISHDLRTPLATITGVATALRHGNLSPTSQAGAELLDTLIDEAERLNRLVSNLLNMSRIESGALETTRAWEEISDLTGGVLARLHSHLANRPLRVVMPSDLPLIWVNAALIDQVLTNLLENALKYTPPATPIVVMAARQGRELWVSVADAGPGIPPAALPKIFDKFVRVDTPGRRTQGSGLGLAICKGIVEAHGGRIWAENRPEGGVAFTLSLPLQPPGAPPAPLALADEAPDERQDYLSRKR